MSIIYVCEGRALERLNYGYSLFGFAAQKLGKFVETSLGKANLCVEICRCEA